MADIVDRRLGALVAEDLQDIEAVFINGARQTGKSTFVSSLGERYENVLSVSFDDISLRAAEAASPGKPSKVLKKALLFLTRFSLYRIPFWRLSPGLTRCGEKNEN